jgi:hypothetical protein
MLRSVADLAPKRARGGDRQAVSRGTLRFTEAAVATREEQRPTTLDEALAQLKRDPDHPVRARVGELDVELRVVGGGVQAQAGLGDLMASAGPWEGESTEELIHILREGRDAGGSAEPPESM